MALAVGVVPGCAGAGPAQLGQMAGSMAGAVFAPGVGAPVGGLVGLLAGMVLQREVDRVTESRERVELNDQLEQTGATTSSDGRPVPTTSVGVPTRVWVDETVQNGRLIAGRFDERLPP